MTKISDEAKFYAKFANHKSYKAKWSQYFDGAFIIREMELFTKD